MPLTGMDQAKTITELHLVRRALGGDRLAFGGLIETRWNGLVRLARSVIGDAEAEDAVQDALVMAWRRLGSLRDPAAFHPWLTRIVLRVSLKRARRFRFWLPLGAAPEPIYREDPGNAIEVERLLGSLAPRQRAVLHMTVIEGMSDSEIGQVMGITAASVRSHRRRARQRLNQLIEE